MQCLIVIQTAYLTDEETDPERLSFWRKITGSQDYCLGCVSLSSTLLLLGADLGPGILYVGAGWLEETRPGRHYGCLMPHYCFCESLELRCSKCGGWFREFTVLLQVAAVPSRVWGWVFRLPPVLELYPWLQSVLFFPAGTHAHMQRR